MQASAGLADGELASRPEVVLYFLQRAFASLWDAHSIEEQAEDANHREKQVRHIQTVDVHHVCEGMCEPEGRHPTDGDTQT